MSLISSVVLQTTKHEISLISEFVIVGLETMSLNPNLFSYLCYLLHLFMT